MKNSILIRTSLRSKSRMSEPESLVANNDGESTQAPQLAELTLKNVLGDIVNGVHFIIFDPLGNRFVVPVIILLTSIITKVIITKVPYTEIDFVTYMQQIQLVNQGEIDYAEISGDTGPIVYPAGFVQIYQWLYSQTNGGADIATGQSIFGYLMTATVVFVCVAYTMSPTTKPWVLFLLLGSKRLYSIYVLRLFNDCFTTAAMVGVTVFLQQGSYWYSTSSFISFLFAIVGADLFSIAISIKMNALLYLPAVVIIAYFLVGENILLFAIVLAIVPLVQILVGWKFLLPLFDDEAASQIRWNYINNAFNFGRKFLFKWTVNWRFIGEETFLSDKFSILLMGGHIVVLLFFIFTRFLNSKVTGKSIWQLIKDAFKPSSTISSNNKLIDYNVGPKLILLILATTNVIGVLFSRSLHYQFLSWYCWQLPFLLHLTGWNFIVCLVLWGAHEWTWNVYPSTVASSLVLVGILSSVLVGTWRNEAVWFEENNVCLLYTSRCV